MVQVTSVHDDTLERGNTLSLSKTSTDDEDYSGMPRLIDDDDDSKISETDAHETDDMVETITMRDDTLKRDDTLSLSTVSTNDEDYSGMSDMTGDADSEISETGAHEVDKPLIGYAVDSGDTSPDLLSYYDALNALGYEAHIETLHDTVVALTKRAHVRSNEAGPRDIAFAFARDPITDDLTTDADEYNASEATACAV